jgi:predicted metal-dependent hydrolase
VSRDCPGAPEGLDQAIELFNSAAYHEAHEVLDELWLATEGPDSDFFKGLIQACIALHHFSLGNLDGARKLYSGHRRLLAPYLPFHKGIDVAALLADMQHAFAPLLRGGEPLALDPRSSPRIARSAP